MCKFFIIIITLLVFYSVLRGRSVSSGSIGIVHLLEGFHSVIRLLSFCISNVVTCKKNYVKGFSLN